MQRKNVFLLLCVLGTVLPYSQFVPWLLVNGPNAQLFIRQLFANRVSGFFALDVLVSAVVLLVFMRMERKRVHMRLLWLPVVGLCAVGVSFGLPLFLYLREGALEAAQSKAGA